MIRRPVCSKLKWPAQTRRVLSLAMLAGLATILHARAAGDATALITPDPAFARGLATLKEAAGFIEDQTNAPSTDWKPNLQLIVGVKAVEGAKQTIYFVQLTTLSPPPTNSLGQPWQPGQRTNDWSWSPTNKTRFITALYPVRVRVFDESGRQLKQGQTPMAWGMLTNGLLDLCRLSLETHRGQTNREGAVAKTDETGKSPKPDPRKNEPLMRATGGGFLWMFGMFGDLQTVPTVADVWGKAQCAIRWPSAWSIAKSFFKGFTIVLMPRTEQVTLVSRNTDAAGPRYRLPVELSSDNRKLSNVEIIVGPAHGAEMLLAGIRSVRARHPTTPKQEFLAQTLAAGSVQEEK